MRGTWNMRKSARVLGEDYGLTAQEMNFVLKEEGFLEGESGNYVITEKGEEYANEQDHHQGTGGYAHYNRYWTTRTWDDGITDELNITEDRKNEIRQAISIAKQKISESENEDIAIEYDNYGYDDEATTVTNDALAAIALEGILFLSQKERSSIRQGRKEERILRRSGKTAVYCNNQRTAV